MRLADKWRPSWTLIAFAVALSYFLFLAAMSLSGFWLHDAHHRIIANDFIDVDAAGKIAVSGHAWQVYDWPAHKAAEVGVVGHSFSEYYGWHYPPPLLFVAAVLAQLPYTLAFFAWIAVTLLFYVFVIARITGKREGMLWACAFPAALLCAYVGQNGFLTAALFGGFLLTLEDNPWLSGVFVGLLTYKPQFGILIPCVLLASGSWRVLLSSTITAALMIGASGAVFGWPAWIAFFHSIPHTTDAVLTAGQAGWNKLQTVYGLARWLGADSHVAWFWQVSAIVLMIAAVSFLWRSGVPFALKATALTVGTLLATPYAYIYDFTVLAVAMAFLYRAQAFDRLETICLLAATLLVFSYPWTAAPVGLAASLLVAGIIVRRWRKVSLADRSDSLEAQSFGTSDAVAARG